MAAKPQSLQEAIKGLQAADKENIDDIIIALQYLTLLESFEEQDLFEPLSVFLDISGGADDGAHIELQRELSRCIAEVTKGDVQRVKFTDPAIIGGLLRNVARISDLNSSPAVLEMVIQACRALGNICYMNDEARTMIGQANGDAVLLSLLDEGNDNPTFYKVRCGLISNYLLGEEEISKRCLEKGHLMEKLEGIINACVQEVATAGQPLNEDLLMNVLPPLSILTENVADLNFDEHLNRNLATILSHSQSLELGEMCLELLHYQAENDDVKLVLAKGGVCQTIFELLEKHKDRPKTDDARAVMKSACDLIVLILTGDEAMNWLHSTDLVANMSAWLRATDTDLITTGVLALGNFARTDSHCIEMVDRGMAKELLVILGKNSSTEGDMKLQHALLSTLRNLVIPKANKQKVIEAGLIQTILPMLLEEGHQLPVVFKLLGTLRMIIDGQEQLAAELLQNEKLIGQLVQWSTSMQDLTGGAVTGESLRLMAWLVKHAYLHKFRRESGEGVTVVATTATTPPEEVNVAALKTFAQVPGAVRAMVEMLASQHLVMQNESLVALTILASFLRHDKDSKVVVDETLIGANVGYHLAGFMKHQHETMTKEIVDNLKTLLAIIGQSEAVKEHLKGQKVEEELENVPVHKEYCTL